MTNAKDAPPPVPQVREARDAVLDDIRIYAAQVVVSASRTDPASAELAETLLRPISSWPTRRGGGAADSDVDGAADPAPVTPAESS